MLLFQITALPWARQGANDVALAGRWPWSLHGSHVASEPCVEPTNEAQVPWEKSKPRADGSFLGEGVGQERGSRTIKWRHFEAI